MRNETSIKEILIPTILCGGSGTRLWPLSRDQYPKQFLSFSGSNTMLQETIARMNGFSSTHVEISQAPIIVCNEEHRFLVAEQAKWVTPGQASIILEPYGRNTAPALTVAAIHASRDGIDPLLLVMPSDHIIRDNDALHRAINLGIKESLEGAILTFGIVPDRPETGYGYIQVSRRGSADRPTFRVAQFVEKPDRETAQSYLASGDYYWNSGMFLLRAGTWIKAMRLFQPAMLDACIKAHSGGLLDHDFQRLDRDTFYACPSDSIDYAIMEKLTSSAKAITPGMVVPLDAGWSDVGSWNSVWEISEKDRKNNVISGDVIIEDTKNSLIFSTSRLVTCVGIENLIIIETPDAIMVADLRKSQDIRSIVSFIKDKARQEGISHRKVHRPWGWYDSLQVAPHFQVKRISVNPGATLSLQSHEHRSEHWVIVQGTARVTLGDKVLTLNQDESVYIPAREKHRITNPSPEILEFIEVQSGSYLGEDDIVRYEDKYGR